VIEEAAVMARVEAIYLYVILPAAYLAAWVYFFRDIWNNPESKETRNAGTLGGVTLGLIRGERSVLAVYIAIPISFVISRITKRLLPRLYAWFQNNDINSLPVWIWALAAIGIFVLLGRDPW
jgi:hypothetical protein